MGIPKFFRWLSERYPLLSQPIGINGAPPVDNLYLDMNGIIHSCTHGNDPTVKLTEEAMVLRIFNYLDKLVHLVKPQQLLFMAIDGCAPRAKMNQQRARRFRSAQEMEEAREAAARKGEPLPADAFDSNCITPGTSFMHRLGKHLRFFIRKKMETDPAWQAPMIVFSGHDVPGEGEHKIMEYIRWAKRDPKYKPNQRHCMYGLDADLIMLSLVTHEPHFVLLREVVQFGGKNSGQPAREIYDNPCADHFILLHIGLLRDYLELEFGALAGELPFEFSVERIIDDFVLLGMLVGNDFLPALPTLDIAEGALNHLFDSYKELLPSMGGYITNAGQLHRQRLEKIIVVLGERELEVLEERARDTEDFENKRRKRNKRDEIAFEAPVQETAVDEAEIDDAMAALAVGAADLEGWKVAGGNGAVPLGEMEIGEEAAPPKLTGATMMSEENRRLLMAGQGETALQAWKSSYYSKAGLGDNKRALVDAYIHGLHWVLEYYYRGVASWNWYYPFHYAPCASDVKDIDAIDVTFTLGKPFLPFQQLLGVLPAASRKHLPQPYHWLFTDLKSPILDFYPTDFECDFEGKRADYEAVILINFIDENRLLNAEKLVTGLSKTEEEQNKQGPMLVFRHQPGSKEKVFCTSTLPNNIASVANCNSHCTKNPSPPPLPPGEFGFIPVLHEATRTGEKGGIPGYPTLKTLKANTRLAKVGVQVFNQASKRESLILCCSSQEGLQAEGVATVVLGERFFIEWPFLKEAEVTAVSDALCTVRKTGVKQHDGTEKSSWVSAASVLANNFLKKGIDIQNVTLVLHVRALEGLTVQMDGTIEKRFSKEEVMFPLQVTLRRHPAPDPRMEPAAVAEARHASLEGLKTGDKALFLGSKYYGSVATILEPSKAGLDHKGQKLQGGASGTGLRLSIDMSGPPPTAASAAKRILGGIHTSFITSGQAARNLKLSSRAMGMLSGNLWVKVGENRDDRVDIGLAVKSTAKGLCVPEFCKQAPSGQGWLYSMDFVKMMQDYSKRFPWVVKMLHDNPEARDYHVKDIFPDLAREAQVSQIDEVRKWLKLQPASSRPLVKITTQVAAEAAVRAIQAAMPPPPAHPPKPVELEGASPSLLLPPISKFDPLMELAGGTFELGDRVAFAGAGEGPAFGMQGAVVGIIDDAIEVLFDAEIPNGSTLHGRCLGQRGGVFLGNMLLNISKPPATSKAPSAHVASNGILDQKPRAPPKAASAEVPKTAAAAVASGGTPQRSSTPDKRAPTSAQRVPKMPQNDGGRGFSMGRGKGVPPPAGVQPRNGSPGPALGSRPQQQQLQPQVEAQLRDWHNKGSELLSALQRSSPGHSSVDALSAALAAFQTSLGAVPPSPPKAAPAFGNGVDAGKAILQQLQGTPSSPAQQGTPLGAVEAQLMAAAPKREEVSPGKNLLAQLQAATKAPQKEPPTPPPPAQQAVAATAALQGLLGIAKGSAGADAGSPAAAAVPSPVPMGGALGDLWEQLKAGGASSKLPSMPASATKASEVDASSQAMPPPPPSSSLLNPKAPAAEASSAPKDDAAAAFWATLKGGNA